MRKEQYFFIYSLMLLYFEYIISISLCFSVLLVSNQRYRHNILSVRKLKVIFRNGWKYDFVGYGNLIFSSSIDRYQIRINLTLFLVALIRLVNFPSWTEGLFDIFYRNRLSINRTNAIRTLLLLHPWHETCKMLKHNVKKLVMLCHVIVSLVFDVLLPSKKDWIFVIFLCFLD